MNLNPEQKTYAEKTKTFTEVISSGGSREDTSLYDLYFIKRPGGKKDVDRDYMITVTKLNGIWENSFIWPVTGKPGFVTIDVTQLSDSNLDLIGEFVISRNEIRYISAKFSRMYVATNAEYFLSKIVQAIKTDNFLCKVKKVEEDIAKRNETRAGLRYTATYMSSKDNKHKDHPQDVFKIDDTDPWWRYVGFERNIFTEEYFIWKEKSIT